MIKAMDNAVGTVLDTLDELKLAENTIVIFTSDNGPMGDVSNARPLRGSKGMYYEGGIREPLFIRWPGTIKPGGESNTPVHQNDLFPTLVKAANAKPPGLLDGRDITPILKGDNLADDPSEQTNLATSKPEKRNALHQELIAWRNATNAPVPTERNPEYQAR